MSSAELFPLPEGARSIKPKLLKTGGWVEQQVDAKLTYKGITWYRVKGGFGDRPSEREDWIADLPEMSLHVGHYLRGASSTWATYGGRSLPENTIFAAMDDEVAKKVEWCEQKIVEASALLVRLRVTHEKLARARAAIATVWEE